MITKEKLKQKLLAIKNLKVKLDQPLNKYTTFQVGGPTDILVIPTTIPSLQEAISIINNSDWPVFILGAGSNIIVSDQGFNGIIIWMKELNDIQVEGNKLIAQTGAKLKKIAKQALKAELTGLEFASGIPGSLGGAIYMNAGAYGGEIKDIITSVTCLNYQGEKVELTKKELNLGYRQSILQKKNLIAVQAEFKLQADNYETIKNKIKELESKRWNKQPMEMPSAGSIFKRPENHYAGALIEEAGLKGTRIGDAQVSPKHAGFIVNLGNATAQDIKQLIEHIQQEVYDYSGIQLETEPKFIGDFPDDE